MKSFNITKNAAALSRTIEEMNQIDATIPQGPIQ
jgi:hypothetical protein